MSTIHIIKTNANPSAAPDLSGQHWVNTTNGRTWFSVGTSSVADWVEIGVGEANLAANVGTGAGVFRDKTGVTLNMRKIKAGANVTVTENADDITVAATGGGGITAGMYAAYSLTGYNILSAPGTIETLFDTQVEDASNLYNNTNGRITIPSGYSGTARGNIKANILLNTANQTGWVLWHLRKNGVFQKYGKGIRLDNATGMDLSFDCDFEFSGVANDYFNITYYCSTNFQLADGRLDVQIYPK